MLAWFGGVVLSFARTAHADIHGDQLDERWARTLDAIRSTLAERDDVDASVEIVVTPALDVAGGVRVVARRPSGESADRRVHDPDDLGPAILALVVVPRRAARPPDPVEPAFDPEQPPEPRRMQLRAALPASRGRRFEAGVLLGVRWQGTVALGGAVFADIEARHWVVGATAGWTTADSQATLGDTAAGVVAMPAGGALHMFELGVGAGRRFVRGPFDLTVQLGPSIVWATRSVQDASFVQMSTPVRYEAPDTTSARFGGIVRLGWTTPSHARLVLGLDASVDVWRGNDVEVTATDHTTHSTLVLEAPQRAFGLGLVLGGAFEVAP